MTKFFEVLESAFRNDNALRPLAETPAVFDTANLAREIDSELDRLLATVSDYRTSTLTPSLIQDLVMTMGNWRPCQPICSTGPPTFNGLEVPRPEFRILLDALRASSEPHEPRRTTLPFGPPGSGKSALLAAIANDLRRQGDSVVGIKADMVPETISTVADLGKSLGFANDIVEEFIAQARSGPIYLLIDQLDAVAALMDGKRIAIEGRDPACTPSPQCSRIF